MVGGSGRGRSGSPRSCSGRSGSSEVLVVVVLMVEIGNRTCSIDTEGFLTCNLFIVPHNGIIQQLLAEYNLKTSLGESEEFLHYPLLRRRGTLTLLKSCQCKINKHKFHKFHMFQSMLRSSPCPNLRPFP